MSSEQDISCIIFSGKKREVNASQYNRRRVKHPKDCFTTLSEIFEQYYFMIWFNSNCNATQANFPFIVRPYLTYLAL